MALVLEDFFFHNEGMYAMHSAMETIILYFEDHELGTMFFRM
jgi:hypothetical protein